ncbi:LppU family putative lipoprotein [Rhodococcus sp. NPDC003322]
MTGWGAAARVAGVVAGAFLVAASVACSAETVEGTAEAQDTTISAPVPTIVGQDVGDGGGRTDFRAEVGDCVQLGGTVDAAEIDKATCGSADSNYKVIGKASKNAQCPSDADQVYYETFGSIEQGALCLDIDWVVGGCMSVPDGDEEPFRVECTDPTASSVERVTEIVEGVTDVERCSEGGFTHPEREFTVCTETVTS